MRLAYTSDIFATKGVNMLDIKRKFLVSLLGLLALIFVIGAVMIVQVRKLGNSIDVILRENYQSVILCQRFNETLEKINEGFLRRFAGDSAVTSAFFDGQLANLNKIWKAELNNITVAGERELADRTAALLVNYSDSIRKVSAPGLAPAECQKLYGTEIYPLAVQLRQLSGEVLELNQKNMIAANNHAREEAARFYNRVLLILFGCAVFAVLQMLLLRHWIEKPIRKLTELTTEIAGGNLDIVLETNSNDEIGQFSRAFNSMTTALRETRRSERMRLERSERTNQDVFKELPTPIAVIDARSGKVEITTQSADRCFGLKAGVKLSDLRIAWLSELYSHVLQTGLVSTPQDRKEVQFFIENREYFFQPVALPIPAGAPPEQLSGVAIILKDVTLAHEQQELKRSVLATVSHQLKTPLTSLQMSIYLLLEEKIGKLSAEQLDLVMSMREDSERLTAIIDDLLDLNRASSQKHFKLEPRRPEILLQDAKERFRSVCLDKDIKMEIEAAPGLPEVTVPVNRINYVFDNLIDNAVRFTPAGGTITLKAEARGNLMRFAVQDTGSGMPEEVRSHLFEQFYRAPGQEASSGVGLGLSIVKEIITALGGTVEVESSEGNGSTFHFTLPLKQDNQPERSSVVW